METPAALADDTDRLGAVRDILPDAAAVADLLERCRTGDEAARPLVRRLIDADPAAMIRICRGDPTERVLRALTARSAGKDIARQEAMARHLDELRAELGSASAPPLERLLAAEHPLVRMIAECALLRTETRGGHCRADFPERDPALDLHHAVVSMRQQPGWEVWT